MDHDQEGDFIGREALARIASEGPSRLLAGVEIAGAPLDLNMTRWPVHQDGDAIGFVTSGRLLASAQPEHRLRDGADRVRGAGTRLSVTTPDGDRTATVVPRPFVDPDKEIPKVVGARPPVRWPEPQAG